MDWGEYERKCEEIREENKKYLQLFEKELEGLAPDTIRKHLFNVDFYINEYLLREETLHMEQGVNQIDSYLGGFFIRKCMWSTPTAVISTAASIKKFYKAMMKYGFVEKEDYADLCLTIKEDMESWKEDCIAFNNLDEEDLSDFW